MADERQRDDDVKSQAKHPGIPPVPSNYQRRLPPLTDAEFRKLQKDFQEQVDLQNREIAEYREKMKARQGNRGSDTP